MIIVRAETEDIKAILELQYKAYQSEAKLLNNFSIQPLTQTLDEVMEEFKKGVILKAIDEEGNIIGSVRAYVSNGTAFIGKLIVSSQEQGNGIGTKLLLAIEKECNASRCELFTSSKSIKNIRLYERLGYIKFQEQKITADLDYIYLEKYI